MESTICNACHNGGYLDFNTYCDCSAGVFYEERDELNLQEIYGELDTGYDSDYYRSDNYGHFESKVQYTTLHLLSIMPFYDGVSPDDFDDCFIEFTVQY